MAPLAPPWLHLWDVMPLTVELVRFPLCAACFLRTSV